MNIHYTGGDTHPALAETKKAFQMYYLILEMYYPKRQPTLLEDIGEHGLSSKLQQLLHDIERLIEMAQQSVDMQVINITSLKSMEDNLRSTILGGCVNPMVQDSIQYRLEPLLVTFDYLINYIEERQFEVREKL